MNTILRIKRLEDIWKNSIPFIWVIMYDNTLTLQNMPDLAHSLQQEFKLRQSNSEIGKVIILNNGPNLPANAIKAIEDNATNNIICVVNCATGDHIELPKTLTK